ncbi:unnamed protein product, partial [Phaeothamnion confervicola]
MVNAVVHISGGCQALRLAVAAGDVCVVDAREPARTKSPAVLHAGMAPPFGDDELDNVREDLRRGSAESPTGGNDGGSRNGGGNGGGGGGSGGARRGGRRPGRLVPVDPWT